MTIEATFVVPVAICVITLILYFSLYLYGRCVLSQDAYILAFRASMEKAEEFKDDPKAYVLEKATEKAGKKYFGSYFPSFEAEVRGKEITVRGHSEKKHRAMGDFFLKPKSGWDYEAFGRAKKYEYSKHARRCMRLKDIGKEILDLGEQ